MTASSLNEVYSWSFKTNHGNHDERRTYYVLQYEKYSYEEHGTGNSRNGYYSRSYDTKYGYKDDLKVIYEFSNLTQCKAALDDFSIKWSKSYKSWFITSAYNESWYTRKLKGFACSYDTLQDMFTGRYS